MSNISLIKLLTLIRMTSWYISLFVCFATRTAFMVQTWSKSFIFVLILNFIFSVMNLFIYNQRGYYQKLKRFLVIFLPILTYATFMIYIIYMRDVYYRVMNLLTLNIMNNDRNRSLLSLTFNYYQCCRIQEEILFDSENERQYFRLFPYCEKSIEENEMKHDQWDNITTCGSIFRSLIFSIRFILILDFILNLIIMILILIHIWKETHERIDDNQCMLTITDNINYKIK